jgi:hypothetical protein
MTVLGSPLPVPATVPPTTYDSRAQRRWRVAHPITTWASGGKTPERLTIVSDADEDTIIERIEDAAEQTRFVAAVGLSPARDSKLHNATHAWLLPNQILSPALSPSPAAISLFRLYIRNSEQQPHAFKFPPFEAELHATGHTLICSRLI